MNIKDNDTLYDKVRKVHDWMVYNLNYDVLYWNIVIMQGTIWYSDTQIQEVKTHLPYSPEWVLENRLAICDGYSEVFKIFMSELDIECIYVASEVMNHAWNMVKMDDGHWYHIDVTFDDLNATEEWSVGWYSTACFLRNDEGISESHRELPTNIPKADGTYYEENINHSIEYQRGENDEYWENGIIKYNYASDGRTYREYDNKGNLLLHRYIQDDGSELYTYYNENGVKTEEKNINTNGEISDVFFNTFGKAIKYVMYYSDGRRVETEKNDLYETHIEYDAAGKVISDYRLDYNPNGTRKQETSLFWDGWEHINIYDENGNFIKEIYKEPEGRIVEVFEEDDDDL